MPTIIPKELFSQYAFIPETEFMDCSFSSDKKYEVFVDCHWMSLWDVKAKELMWKLDSMDYRMENNYNVEITPDNRYIITAGNRITCRDLITGEILWTRESPYGTAIALKITSDGKKGISACGSINIFDLKSGKSVKELVLGEDYKDYHLEVSDFAITHDTELIAANLSAGETVVWESSGNLIYWLREGVDANFEYIGLELEFSPDGIYLASMKFDRRSIDIWEMSTGKQINQLRGPNDNELWSITFLTQESLTSKTKEGDMIIWEYLSRSEKPEAIDISAELISAIKNLRQDNMIIQIKKLINDHIRHFFENPSRKTIRKLTQFLPEYLKGWPKEFHQLINGEYLRVIELYKTIMPSKWKKWSKKLLSLIPLIGLSK